jgi:hypothetical protein
MDPRVYLLRVRAAVLSNDKAAMEVSIAELQAFADWICETRTTRVGWRQLLKTYFKRTG